MSALGSKLRKLEGGRVAFFCPGCKEMHQVTVKVQPRGREGSLWGWNGDGDAPTFTPSIMVRGTRLDMTDEEMDRMFEEFDLPQDRERLLADSQFNTVCHSFVRDGKIQFLSDCTHAPAGQTVDLPDLDGRI